MGGGVSKVVDESTKNSTNSDLTNESNSKSSIETVTISPQGGKFIEINSEVDVDQSLTAKIAGNKLKRMVKINKYFKKWILILVDRLLVNKVIWINNEIMMKLFQKWILIKLARSAGQHHQAVLNLSLLGLLFIQRPRMNITKQG
jgi:hypothetical protein